MKQRYFALDAMRGIAAIAVFLHHGNALSHPLVAAAGYRAVDLFFVLSGFVLTHSYEDRLLAGYGVRRFMLDRLVRLYPLYLVGALLGIAGAWIAYRLGGGQLGLHTLVPATLSLLVFLPSPTWSYTGELVPLNVPCWSLFLELLANLAFALCLRWLTTARLVLGVVVAGTCLAAIAIAHGNANLGSDWATITGGLSRVTFSFFLGCLLYRLKPSRMIRSHWAWLLPVATIPLLCLGSEELVMDLLCIFILFPILIGAGAMFETPGHRLPSMLGDTSYGLYVVHVPAILLVYKAFSFLKSDANRFAPATGLMLLFALLVFVVLADRWYDRPVRRYLKRRLSSHGTTQPRELS